MIFSNDTIPQCLQSEWNVYWDGDFEGHFLVLKSYLLMWNNFQNLNILYLCKKFELPVLWSRPFITVVMAYKHFKWLLTRVVDVRNFNTRPRGLFRNLDLRVPLSRSQNFTGSMEPEAPVHKAWKGNAQCLWKGVEVFAGKQYIFYQSINQNPMYFKCPSQSM